MEESQKSLRAEALAKAAGIELRLTKDRFMFSRETLMNLLLKVSTNEYIRGWNNHVCMNCQALYRSGKKPRPLSKPDKTWDFCSECEKQKGMMKKSEESTD